jgi:LemA protein
MSKLLTFGIAVLVTVIIVVVLAVSGYNRLVRLSQGTDSQWAQVQNVYQRRADLIPNLVATVAGAANFEKSTLTEVTNARASVGQVKVDPSNAPTDPAQLAAFEQAQGALTSALSRLLVVVERYPELRSNENFLNLQAQLEGTENRISVERGKFNTTVQQYNTAVRSFPSVLYAGAFGFREKPYFSGTPQAQTPPGVQFDFGPGGTGGAATPGVPTTAPAGAR